ncbi:MAG: hypothetical protein HQK55_15625 [Deltaproteobacteria bacterium]|nr:hypothetical protein [Deltaproteobacteria bacterium]
MLATKVSFLEAMRLGALWIFFQQIQRARARNEKCLVIEDGGYLMPLINQFCLEGHSLGDVLRNYAIPEHDFDQSELYRPLRDWLGGTLLGSIEHTRNGYDMLVAIQERFGCLAFPTGTIAVSEFKRTIEADEVARSCVLAIQMILYSAGQTLTNRRGVIIGSRGHIGRYLVELLGFILGHQRICGVVIVVPPAGRFIEDGVHHWYSFDDIPEEYLKDSDLFIGVSGCSVIDAPRLERLIKITRHEDLYFASGSTKTIEYTDLLSWVETLLRSGTPSIGGEPVQMEKMVMRDPLSRLDQGITVVIRFTRISKVRRLHLMAHLMPVNFLYYGVPREIIDIVITQLLEISIGLSTRARNGDTLPPKLLALDKNREFTIFRDGGRLEEK